MSLAKRTTGPGAVLCALADLVLSPVTLCAVWWVRRREAVILRDGAPLDAAQCALARAAGVSAPGRVRVMAVARLPMPLPAALRRIAEQRGWLSPHIAGMTFGYGIALREDCVRDRRLLAHEFAHVAQYERHARGGHDGRHAGFLRRYVRECVWPGYPRGPLEAEARRAEALAAPTQPRENVIPYPPV
jgi:Domain of unknown function (DUF4157)